MSNQTTLNRSDFIRKPRKNGTRPERYYRVDARCGHTTYLRIHDANKAVAENRQCAKCHQAHIAAKGYKTCAQKYGEDFAIQMVIKQQLAKPSKPEQQIAAWLDEMNIPYQRQVVVDLGVSRYIVDFMLDDGKAIEGAGGYWHSRNKTTKDALLAESMTVLFLTDDLIMTNPDEAKRKIAQFAGC